MKRTVIKKYACIIVNQITYCIWHYTMSIVFDNPTSNIIMIAANLLSHMLSLNFLLNSEICNGKYYKIKTKMTRLLNAKQ